MGVDKDSGRHVEFQHKIAYSYLELRCECMVNIACALRWGVASVGIILYWAWLTLHGKTFQVQGVHRWTALSQGRNCEESWFVAL